MLTTHVAAITPPEPDPGQFIAMDAEETFPAPSRWGMPEWFAVAQVAGPALLYLPGTQAFRAPLRFGVFALSLIGLLTCLRSSRLTRAHPSWALLVIAAVYMVLMIFHPATNTVMAGLAQTVMHLAIAAPLFWAPRYFLGDYGRLLRMLTILWVLNGASTLVGILQVRDPATWMPAEFSRFVMDQKHGLSMYQYSLGGGRTAIRPPGLGDIPGAACAAGLFVAIIGQAYLGLPVSHSRKLLGVLIGAAGMLVILLSHVRSSLVVLLGCTAVYSIIMVAQGRMKAVLSTAIVMMVCGTIAFGFAEVYGGRSTIDRFATLFEDDPLTVYARSTRLSMVTNAFDTLLFDYPLGAGLGRWGMMRRYFGNEYNSESPEIWAEVQFVAWVLDGGVVLLTLYLVALAIAIYIVLRASLGHRSILLRKWGAVILMLSAGPIALLFSYCPFNSQVGMQFWLLIGAFRRPAQRRGERRCHGRHRTRRDGIERPFAGSRRSIAQSWLNPT